MIKHYLHNTKLLGNNNRKSTNRVQIILGTMENNSWYNKHLKHNM